MDIDQGRRALLGAIAVGGVGATALSPVRSYVEQFGAPYGSVWAAADRSIDGTVGSPHGEATVHRDDAGVPHVFADDENAAYYAIGYLQAFDRGFQMDLQRRQMRGQLSAVVGDLALESDRFYVGMDFAGAAEANWDVIKDSAAGPATRAYVEGVNAAFENEQLGIEFELLEYEPDPWTPVDSMLMEKQISWGLTGSFLALKKAIVADAVDEAAVEELYPRRLDHDSPIIRGSEADDTDRDPEATPEYGRFGDVENGAVGAPLVEWLADFERDPGIGSNSWVVSGEYTDTGEPYVCNDPHLTLMAPPVWYEQRVEADDASVRGVTFPGVPFVIIGESATGAWGFTNSGADVIDFYRYDTREGEYRYGDEWRAFETEEREIEVSGGQNETVEVRKTVHGPVVERQGFEVGVAWTGMTADRTTEAIYEYAHAEGVEDFVEATRKFDSPPQNLVYADREGNTLYYTTGKIPVRRIDGEVVPGDRIFDGSAPEGEWAGFVPYGETDWTEAGFFEFNEKPHVINPDYLGTANQRIVDDPTYYLSEGYSSPYRGRRLYELLDRRAGSDRPMDAGFHQRVQADARDGRAVDLVPELLEAAEGEDGLADAVSVLGDWDYHMDRDSEAALLFDRWVRAFMDETFSRAFEGYDRLDSGFHPRYFVLAELPEDSRWFGERGRTRTMLDALETATKEVEESEQTVWGDRNTTAAITHPLGSQVGFLDYPVFPTDGSAFSLNNYRVEGSAGSSWRMVASMDGPSIGVLPGGNSGDYFDENYADQLRRWADTDYKALSFDGSDQLDDPAVRFEGGEN